MKPEPRLLPANGNWKAGRGGRLVDLIVVHVMDGTLHGTDGWFRNPESGVSAHYGVGRDGRVLRWVDEGDVAFHAGKKVRPTAELVLERATENPNNYSVGIECEGRAKDEPTPELMRALAAVVRDVAARHRIPLDRRHVIGHREIRADKTCPGKIDVDEVVRLARGTGGAPEPGLPHREAEQAGPRTGDRRWSEYLGEHVILTRYESDTKWHFVRESMLRRLGAAGAVPWSQMPPARP